MHRRTFLALATGVAAFSLALGGASSQELPKLKQKEKYKVGFAQTESNNPWRIAQTESMKAEAAKLGHQLVYTDAAGSAAKQVADVNSMIAQGVDLIFLAPREEKPLIPAVMAAKKAGIPVILLDRNVDQGLAKAGRGLRHLHRLRLRGRRQARRRGADQDRQRQGQDHPARGHDRLVAGQRPRARASTITIKAHPGMKIVASQSGDFARDKGRQVAETLLQAHPDATAIYAHNDEMAIGAIAALEAAGKKPGKDVIVVSDRRRRATPCRPSSTARCSRPSSAIRSSVRRRSRPWRATPRATQIEPWVINTDRFFDKTNAAQLIGDAY